MGNLTLQEIKIRLDYLDDQEICELMKLIRREYEVRNMVPEKYRRHGWRP